MEKNNSPIFVDSNFYIALNNPSDTQHEKALQFSRKLRNKNLTTYISNFVFHEVVTVLSQRTTRSFAIEVGHDLLQNDQLIMIDESLQLRSWEIFQKIEKKNVGFVDCSIIAVMEHEGIDSLLTFDTEDFRPLQKKFSFKLYSP